MRRQPVRPSGELTAAAASAAAATVGRVPPEPDPAAGAFFDVDNTIMRGASLFHFARGLAARKLFTTRDLARMTWQQLSLRIRGSENTGHMASARDSALAFVAGHKVDEIIELGEEIYDETMADRIWAGTRELAQRHLDAGQRVWLVTATPVELADIIARRLGLTGALGTVAESVDGVYTGRLIGGLLHGPAKPAAIAALAAREGLDLGRCAAYSDSINDLPMLLMAGEPHAVNPDGELRAEARRNGWPVHEFRTGRRAAMIALPAAGAAGAVAGGVAAGLALRKRRAAPVPDRTLATVLRARQVDPRALAAVLRERHPDPRALAAALRERHPDPRALAAALRERHPDPRAMAAALRARLS